jgi:hypothetical protein
MNRDLLDRQKKVTAMIDVPATPAKTARYRRAVRSLVVVGTMTVGIGGFALGAMAAQRPTLAAAASTVRCAMVTTTGLGAVNARGQQMEGMRTCSSATLASASSFAPGKSSSSMSSTGLDFATAAVTPLP